MSAPPPQSQPQPMPLPGSHPAVSPLSPMHAHPANNQLAGHPLPMPIPIQPQPHPATGPILLATLPTPILPLAPQPQPSQPIGPLPPYFPSPPLPAAALSLPALASVPPPLPSIISDPSDWKANNEAGMLMHRNGLLENSVDYLTLAVHAAPPDCSQPRRNLAMVKVDIGTRYKLSGNVETAMRLYEEALSVLPSFAPAYFNLAVIYSERAQYEQALKYYQLAVQHNPNYVEALCVGEDVEVRVKRGGVGEWTDVRAGDVCEDDVLMDERGEPTPIVPPIVPLHDQPLYRIDCYPHLALSAADASTSLLPLHSYTVSHRHLVTVQCLATPFLHHHANLTHLVFYRVKGGHISPETLVGDTGESGLERLWQRWHRLDRSDVCVQGELYDVYVEELCEQLDNPTSSYFREHIVGVRLRHHGDSDTSVTLTPTSLFAPPPSFTSCSHTPSSPPSSTTADARVTPSYTPLDLVITPLAHTGAVVGLSVASPTRRYLLSSRVATHNCNIGVIYKNSAQLSMAIEYYEKALKANPNFHIAASNLAIALTDKGTSVKNEGRIEEGISYYKRALHHNSKYPSSWYNLGVAYAEKGRADDAKVCYEMAVLFDKACAEAFNNLGVIYKDRGNLDQAIHYYHEALQANPAFSQTLNNLSVIYTMLGKLDEAYEYCSRAIKTNPHYAEALNNLGVLYRDEGRIEEAIHSYAECLRIDPLSKNAGQNRLLALNSLTRLDATVRAAMAGAGNKEGDVNGLPTNGVGPGSPTFITSPSIHSPADSKSAVQPALAGSSASPSMPSFTPSSPLSCLLPPAPADAEQQLMDSVYEAHRQWGVTFSALYERDRYTDWPECFAQSDTRVLTDAGLLYLDEIEARLAAGQRVQYGCYERASRRLKYADGKLVLSAAPSHLVEFSSQPHKRQKMDSGSDVSIRVTPNHRMFAQLDHAAADCYETTLASSLLSPPDAPTGGTVRMLASADAGYEADGACSELEQLRSELSLGDEHLDAFFTLLGFYLVHGFILPLPRAVEFGIADSCWLQQLVDRVGLSAEQYELAGDLRISEPSWAAWYAREMQTRVTTRIAHNGVKSGTGRPVFSIRHVNCLPNWMIMRLPRSHALAVLHGLQRGCGASSTVTGSILLSEQLTHLLLNCGLTSSVRALPGNQWEVSWTDPADDTAAAQHARRPAINRQHGVRVVPYCAERDGRVWCVEVDHPDHLIVAQRAIRSADGAVTRQHRPLVVGNSKKVKDRQLRVGYLSADFFVHSVSYFIEAPLAYRDRSSFHVTCYSNVARKDKKTGLFEALCDTWRSVHDKSSREVAELVRRDRIDILVELTGHTAGNRLDVMALHPAPVQCTWIGYPNTTGLPAIDYRITDSIVDPPGTTQKYTEQLLRLPGPFLCYTPPPDAPAVTATPALKNGYVTFGSFNNLAKVNARVLAVWCAILHSVPFSRLLMKCKPFASPTVVAKMHAKFAAFGIPSTRVDLISLLPTTSEHLDAYAAVDISVDTFPYAGTTTTCEALYMGVPVITLHKSEPPLHAHNVGATLLSRIGAEPGQIGMDAGLGPLLIAETEREYVDMAVRLCADVPRLQSIRQGMRERMLSSSLCQGKQFVEQLEQLYRKAWEAHCDKA